MPQNSKIFQTKPHFKLLDGLRGLAAVAVVIFHFMEFIKPDYADSFIAHGYLAVDFFFCLSGFVIAYAYDHRVGAMGIWPFLKLRLIRLHPLVVLGSVLGVLCFVGDPFSNLYKMYGLGETLMMFFTSCLMIPYPAVPERYYNLFHLNPPTWSLLWEYVANVAYVLFLFRVKNKVTTVLTVIAGVILIYTSYHYTYLGVGWGVDSYLGGGARIFYSFFAGMLIFRSNLILKNRLGFVALSVLLGLVFLVPYLEAANWYLDLIIVLICFPLLVSLGAGARLKPAFEKVCTLSGAISYPLYMIHYPFLWLFYSYVETQNPSMTAMTLSAVFGTLALLTFAYVVLIYFDTPVRAYLKNRLKKKELPA